MKIAIPVDEKNWTTKVAASFGRAPFFLIYDTISKEEAYIENSGAVSTGGGGIKAAQEVVDGKGEVVISFRCGENAAQVLHEAGIILFKANKELAKDNIQDYLEGKLGELTEIHSGLHHHGGA